jgi:hypothetical protein
MATLAPTIRAMHERRSARLATPTPAALTAESSSKLIKIDQLRAVGGAASTLLLKRSPAPWV